MCPESLSVFSVSEFPSPVTFYRQIFTSVEVDVYELVGGASGRTGHVEHVDARVT